MLKPAKEMNWFMATVSITSDPQARSRELSKNSPPSLTETVCLNTFTSQAWGAKKTVCDIPRHWIFYMDHAFQMNCEARDSMLYFE